ncbi:hypothetical protein [Ottowia sp. oral taxon 894]|nr:hypothetical protein [Ottowia sp. oral taxon 894]
MFKAQNAPNAMKPGGMAHASPPMPPQWPLICETRPGQALAAHAQGAR